MRYLVEVIHSCKYLFIFTFNLTFHINQQNRTLQKLKRSNQGVLQRKNYITLGECLMDWERVRPFITTTHENVKR